MEENQYPYSKSSIQANAPARSGVYLIDSPKHWIYVGEAGDIQGRLLEHYSGASDQSDCIDRYNPATFDYELVAGRDARKERQDELIRRLGPQCNRTS